MWVTPSTLRSFSGCGGLGLGLHRAIRGARTVLHVEVEAYACAVLASRMEEGALDWAPIFSDVCRFDGRPWRGVVDCVVGGSPCQDLSIAGKRAGLGGARSGLFFELMGFPMGWAKLGLMNYACTATPVSLPKLKLLLGSSGAIEVTCRIRLSKSTVLDLHSRDLLHDGFRCWVTGESGSGKSTAVALIVEQVVAQKNQVLVLDLHGEYGNLWATDPENVVRVGYGALEVQAESVSWCLNVLAAGKSLVLDLSHWSDIDPEKLDVFMLDLLRGLYELRRREPKWTLVVVEEAQQIIPQTQAQGQAENIRIFLGMITGGRKYGIQFILTSQRQSLVDINAISSCNVRLFMRVSEMKDWTLMKKYIPDSMDVTFNDPRTGIKRFPTGKAMLLSRWTNDIKIQLYPAKMQLRQPLLDSL